jgi:hypothetical protein
VIVLPLCALCDMEVSLCGVLKLMALWACYYFVIKYGRRTNGPVYAVGLCGFLRLAALRSLPPGGLEFGRRPGFLPFAPPGVALSVIESLKVRVLVNTGASLG